MEVKPKTKTEIIGYDLEDVSEWDFFILRVALCWMLYNRRGCDAKGERMDVINQLKLEIEAKFSNAPKFKHLEPHLEAMLDKLNLYVPGEAIRAYKSRFTNN